MRISRVASILPMFALLAGCATEDVSDQKPDESIFAGSDQDALQYAGDLALNEALDRPHLFEGVEDMTVSRVFMDEEGRVHARLGQTVGGIPVFEGEAIVQLGKDGKFDKVIDRFQRRLTVNLKPEITAEEATEIAVNEFGGANMLLETPKVDMQILHTDKGDHLTYRVQTTMRNAADEPTMPVVFVDAHTREIVRSFDNLETVKNRKTYTINGGTNPLPGTLKRSEGQAANGDTVLDQAHDNAGRVYDFYATVLSRDSFDGAGATITSTVHYSKNYVNAFWNGSQMVYGDGDGVQSNALTVLDVVGHEITHAVTERSSNLTYANESGALNEAMSDIFGAAIEASRDGGVNANTWKVGEECWTPGTAGDALRYMDEPTKAPSDKDYYPTRYVGSQDNGGVHWNSGIANLAFVLAVTGGTHPRGVTSNVVPALDSDANVAIQKGAKIFYRANTQCMTSGSNFATAAQCTIDAATALYGASAATSITEAWKAVGVTPAGGGGGGGATWTTIGSQTGISGSRKSKKYYTIVAPSGASELRFNTAGPNGDADLYVRKGANPTTATYDCRSASAASNESCTISTVTSGATYYIMVYGYSAYSGLTLTVDKK